MTNFCCRSNGRKTCLWLCNQQFCFMSMLNLMMVHVIQSIYYTGGCGTIVMESVTSPAFFFLLDFYFSSSFFSFCYSMCACYPVVSYWGLCFVGACCKLILFCFHHFATYEPYCFEQRFSVGKGVDSNTLMNSTNCQELKR